MCNNICSKGYLVAAQKTAAGYHLGAVDECGPVCRLSWDTYGSKEEAEKHLNDRTFRIRICDENMMCAGRRPCLPDRMNEEERTYPELLDAEVNLIKKTDIKWLVKNALERVSKEFWTAAASSTGKYHPAFAAGIGGLVRHTRAAVWFAQQILELEESPYAYMADYIYAALILHDTAKHGIPWGVTTIHNHPLLVESYLDKEELSEEEWEKWQAINNLISRHMGQWRTSKYSDIVLPQFTDGAQFFIHTCDLLASKKCVSLDFLCEKPDDCLPES